MHSVFANGRTGLFCVRSSCRLDMPYAIKRIDCYRIGIRSWHLIMLAIRAYLSAFLATAVLALPQQEGALQACGEALYYADKVRMRSGYAVCVADRLLTMLSSILATKAISCALSLMANRR